MTKRELGMPPLEPLTSKAAIEKIVQTLGRLPNNNDRLAAAQEAIKEVTGFEIRIMRS